MTASKKVVLVANVFTPLPVFSQAVISNGFIYVSGTIGCDKNSKLVKGGVEAEARAALENMIKILEGAGTRLANAVKMNVYLVDFDRDFASMNEVYKQFFGTENLPARTCVGVARLPLNANVEIECVAAVPQ